jgi:hypothetical protein
VSPKERAKGKGKVMATPRGKAMARATEKASACPSG